MRHHGEMQRCWRKRFATVALAAVVLPWPATAAVALHEAHEHGTVPAPLAAVLHAHEHEPGTPPHDHTLTPAAPVASDQLRLFVTRMVRAEGVASTRSRLDDVFAGAPPRETASPPAPATSSKPILRI